MSDLNGRQAPSIDFCLGDRRLVCRQHRLGEEEAAALVLLTKGLAHFVDTIVEERVESADALLRFIGKRAGGDLGERGDFGHSECSPSAPGKNV